jgi:hypothetical protein
MSDEAVPQSSIILYQTEDGRTRIQCRFEDETLWLTQALIAELFQTTPQNVTLHLQAIYEEGELAEAATCKDYLQVRTEGMRQVSRQLRHYSLPAILAVGYRVRSARGTQFRQWATARLSEYLVKGFTMDDERLRNPPGSGVPDYFDELLERIRDIRASEKLLRTSPRTRPAGASRSSFATVNPGWMSSCNSTTATCCPMPARSVAKKPTARPWPNTTTSPPAGGSTWRLRR